MRTRGLFSIVIACILAAASVLILPGREAASWRESFSPRLLEPSGVHAVGFRSLRLDTGADDPWNPGRPRVVMVDIHYPAAAGEHPLNHYARSPYMSELGMLAWAPDHEQRLGLHHDEVNWLFRTHSHQWAPPRDGTFPVIVISAPPEAMRTSLTTLAEDLASHGFIAVTVDHPYDAPVVELWPTREVIEASDAQRELTRREAATVRAADVAAVADRVPAVDEEIEKVVARECLVVVADDLQEQVAALTDDPMIDAQIAARYPRVVTALDPLPSMAGSERDFRADVADFRAALIERLTLKTGCRHSGGS